MASPSAYERHGALFESLGCTRVGTSPEVLRLPLPVKDGEGASHAAFTVNCYLVKSGDACLVVDPGAYNETAQMMLLAVLDALGVDSAEVVFFVTHLHSDHAGMVSAPLFQENPVYVGQREYEHACLRADEDCMEAIVARFVEEGLPPDRAADYQTQRWDAPLLNESRLRFLSDGDELPVGSERFKALLTPGHTPGHTMLVERGNRILFGGDGVLFPITPVLQWTPGNPCVLGEYISSLRRLSGEEADCFAPGHGSPQASWRGRVRWLIGHHLDRVKRIERFARAHPGSTGLEIAGNAGWSLSFDRWGELPFVQRISVLSTSAVYLDYLVAQGPLRRERGEEGSFRYYPS